MDQSDTDINDTYYSSATIDLFTLSIFAIILFSVSVNRLYTSNMILSVKDTLLITSVYLTLFILADALYRLLYSLFEASVKNRPSLIVALETNYNFDTASIVIIVFALTTLFFLTSGLSKNVWDYVWHLEPAANVACTIFSFILLRALYFCELTRRTGLGMHTMAGLDYGTGMAYSYYYGYLRIVLPNSGTANKGFLEKIENFEDSHGVKIEVKKLFILIPSSSYIPPDLKEISDGWMESAVLLEEEIRDRAGNKGRTYRNNVYKIYKDKRRDAEPEYVVAEGATPILTFFEVQKHAHKESQIYQRHRKEVIATFSKKLEELLKADPDCRDLADVVYYEDYDSNGKKVNVAKIILERISEIVNS